MRSITVKFDDGDSLSTNINGTDDEIAKYYLGQDFTKRDETQHKAICNKFHDTGKVVALFRCNGYTATLTIHNPQ